jgi:hypothetical protein
MNDRSGDAKRFGGFLGLLATIGGQASFSPLISAPTLGDRCGSTQVAEWTGHSVGSCSLSTTRRC